MSHPSSSRYSHLPSRPPPPPAAPPSVRDGLMEHEDVHLDEEDDDDMEFDSEGRDDDEYDDDVLPPTPLPLRVDSSASSPFASSTPLDLSLDRDSSLSSRHSESHPFDQDVHHMESSQMHLVHGQQAMTPTSQATPNHTSLPQQPQTTPAAPPSTSAAAAAGRASPAVLSSAASDAGHLSIPLTTLRKSVSYGDKLAGRARELAVQQTKRLDAIVRGIEEEEADYVEDHILETLDYDAHEDTMNELAIEKSGALHTNYLLLLKVFMMILIGFITAMLMYSVSQGVQLIYSNKIKATTSLIEAGQGAAAYFAFLFMNLAITTVGSSLVAIVAPHARGGGVPYALSYLNGTNVAEYFSPRIVLVKVVTLIFTIAGGLTLGMEGPFVFIGGGVALLCSNLIDRVFPFFFIGFGGGSRGAFSRVIRNIREERIFMAGGLAAGLAVAFDAPIAGVLFALEGSTTFLTVPVVLRIFGCAMFASFFNDLGHNNFSSEVINHNLIEPTENGAAPWAFSIPEVLPFTVLGLMGGVLGAGATWMNIKMTHWRHHHMEGKRWKDIGKQVAEVAIFTAATSTIWFVLPYIFGCREVGSQCVQSVEGGASRCAQLQCSEGSYSEIGAFVYSSSDEVARLLFDRSLSYSEDYHVGPLIVYGAAYWVLVSLIYGAFVPGGLFVPSIVVGGMYGRVVGIFVEYLFPTAYINPGVYALLGAASMLGGFTRLALPVVLMLIELTGDATYLLPIMYCAMVGKFIADYLFPPLYPQHMALEKIPTLTDNLNPVIAKLHAHDLMIKKERIACLGVVERLLVIRTKLLASKRVLFPLLTPTGQLVGCIGRRSIMRAVNESRSYGTYQEALLLEEHTTAREGGGGGGGGAGKGGRGRGRDGDWHQSTLTNNNALSSSSFTQFEDNWVNLRAFCDQGVITAHPSTPSKRLQMLFRRLGISHLCVTDRHHTFLGFVTRRCLIYPPTTNATSATSATSDTIDAHDRTPPRSVPLPATEELDGDEDNGGVGRDMDLYDEADDGTEEKSHPSAGRAAPPPSHASSAAVARSAPSAPPVGPSSSSARPTAMPSRALYAAKGGAEVEDEEWGEDDEPHGVESSRSMEVDEDAGDEGDEESSGTRALPAHSVSTAPPSSSAPLSFAAQHAMFKPTGRR